MLPGVPRLARPQPAKLCLEVLARHAPAAASSAVQGTMHGGAAVDTTPTSFGCSTPAWYHGAVETPRAVEFTPTAIPGSVFNSTPTPIGIGTFMRYNFSPQADCSTSARSQVQSPFGFSCLTQPPGSGFKARDGHHVHFYDPVVQLPSVSDSFSSNNSSSVTLSDERECGKSASERSCSISICVGRPPSNDFSVFSVKNTFIHVDSDGSDSDDDVCIPVQKSKSMPNEFLSRPSKVTGAWLDDDRADGSPPKPREQGLPSAEEAKKMGLPSVGSALHGTECKPCAFFWKPESCLNGVECFHCHACPDDEIKRRKKQKLDELKKAKKLAKEKKGGCA